MRRGTGKAADTAVYVEGERYGYVVGENRLPHRRAVRDSTAQSVIKRRSSKPEVGEGLGFGEGEGKRECVPAEEQAGEYRSE